MKIEDKSIIKGIIFIIISAFGFACMQLFVKMAGDLPPIQKSFFRNVVSMIIILVPLLSKGFPKVNIKGSWTLLIIRSVFGTTGVIFNFMAVSYIPLADAAILQKLSPFIVVILSLIFLKEKVKVYQWVSIFIAFVGVYIIVQPNGADFNIGHIAGVGGALMSGIAYTALRKLGIRGVNGQFIIFFFSAFSCIALLPFVILYYQPITFEQLIYLIFIGISAAIGQVGITFAYKNAPAKNIAVFEYSQIIFASLMGFFIFSEIPTTTSIIGYIIIISVGIFMTIKGAKKS